MFFILIIGIVGSYVGAVISQLFNEKLTGAGYLKNFLFCVIGAVVVLWIWLKLFGSEKGHGVTYCPFVRDIGCLWCEMG